MSASDEMDATDATPVVKEKYGPYHAWDEEDELIQQEVLQKLVALGEYNDDEEYVKRRWNMFLRGDITRDVLDEFPFFSADDVETRVDDFETLENWLNDARTFLDAKLRVGLTQKIARLYDTLAASGVRAWNQAMPLLYGRRFLVDVTKEDTLLHWMHAARTFNAEPDEVWIPLLVDRARVELDALYAEYLSKTRPIYTSITERDTEKNRKASDALVRLFAEYTDKVIDVLEKHNGQVVPKSPISILDTRGANPKNYAQERAAIALAQMREDDSSASESESGDEGSS